MENCSNSCVTLNYTTPRTMRHSETYVTAGTVLLSLLIPVIVIGNTLVILAFALTRHLRTTTNYFVISLAFTDLMVGVLSLPIFTVAIHNPTWTKQNSKVQQMWTAMDMITSITSIVNLMYISIDRYLSIKYPLRYPIMMTKTKIIVMIVLSWVYGVLNYSLIQFTYKKGQPRPDVNLAITFLAFILPLVVILIMYARIGKIAFNHRMRILGINQQMQNQISENAGRIPATNNHTSIVSLTMELKATQTLAVVVGAFLLCYIGYFVILLHTTICIKWQNLKCSRIPPKVWISLEWIKFFNSSLNPMIYTAMNKGMRKAIQRVCKLGCISTMPESM